MKSNKSKNRASKKRWNPFRSRVKSCVQYEQIKTTAFGEQGFKAVFPKYCSIKWVR